MYSLKYKIRGRYKCSTRMFFLFSYIISFLKNLCNYKLNLLLWISCFVLVVFIVSMSQHKSEFNQETPIIVWWTESFPGPKNSLQTCEDRSCYVTNFRNITSDRMAYLFYGSVIHFDDLPLPRNPAGVIWGLYHEESPRNVEYFMHEEALKLFNYSSTFSRYSDVPFVLQYLERLDDITSGKYFVTTSEKNHLLDEIAPVLYLQTDCDTMTERDDYVLELMKHIPVDSYGECLNNKRLPEKFKSNYLMNLNEQEFLKFVARYKFTIAIENGVCEDYITEKFWRPLTVGSVPLYFGSPSIRDWMPNEASAILLQDYQSVVEVADYLMQLLNNDTLYEKHLVHKTKNILANDRLVKEFAAKPYVSDALRTAEDFECFVCHRLHDQNQGDIQESVVNKRHYDCPKPLSALTNHPNEHSNWVSMWDWSRLKVEEFYRLAMGIS